MSQTSQFEFGISLLEEHKIFAAAGRDALNAIIFNAETHSFSPHEIIFRQGDKADDAWLILNGEAYITREDVAGRMSSAHLETGMLAGESALFNNTKRRCTLCADTYLEALRLQRTIFLRAVHTYPDLAQSVRIALQDRLSKSVEALRSLG